MGWMVFSQPLYTLVNLCEILQLKKTLVNVLFTDKFSEPPRLSDYSSLLQQYIKKAIHTKKTTKKFGG